MDFVIITNPDQIEIMMSGQFTFNFNQKFKQIIELLDGLTQKSVIIDLGKVAFIDSSGLGMLLLLRDECTKKNIGISLRNAQGQVEKILTISKFDNLFQTV